ncbi:MAG TPA: DsbA family protein [Rhodanobacteraceae bacterium]|nr:DsbA family protein [Rhodanobacteraceae bacterium]
MTSTASTTTIAPVRVDVWSDFVCPFCLIGSLRLDQLAEKQPIETVWHAFMLRPPGSPGMTAEKRAMIEAYTPKISAQIRDEFGLDVRRGPIGAQTFAAHHAMKHAERKGHGAAFHDAVLRAYWLDGADIANHEVLRKLGERFDLAFDDELLAGRDAVTADAVQTDIAQATQYNIHGVPAFIFANRYFVSGAQPLALLERAADAARQGHVAIH